MIVKGEFDTDAYHAAMQLQADVSAVVRAYPGAVEAAKAAWWASGPEAAVAVLVALVGGT